MTANAMTPLSVMAGAERLSLESPVPSKGHAGCGGGREETYWVTSHAPCAYPTTHRNKDTHSS